MSDLVGNPKDRFSCDAAHMMYSISLQDEAPYFQEVLNDINQKIGDLKDMNREQEIPELLAAQKEIQEQFDKATMLANQLGGVMADFSDERSNLQKEIEAETEWLNKAKEMLAKCDDVSGNDEDLVQRLQKCKVGKTSYEHDCVLLYILTPCYHFPHSTYRKCHCAQINDKIPSEQKCVRKSALL